MRPFAARTLLLAAVLAAGVYGAVPSEARAQEPAGPTPTLVPLSGQFTAPGGEPRTGSVVVVISLYEGRDDSAPRWVEHQTVTLDAQGRYDVRFGSTRSEGLPADLFTVDSGSRWIGVGIENEPEQPRVMLVSVPYAARAASADALGGRAASEFVTTTNLTERVREAIEETDDDDPIGTDAVLNFLQKSDGTPTGLVDSAVFETGGNVGIGTTAPASLLHLRSNLNLPAFRLENTTPGAATWQVTSASDGELRVTEIGAAVRLMIEKGGFVGIGTQTPTQRLHVNGNALVVGDMTVNGNIAAKYQDVAEWVDAVGRLEPGTVVMIDITGSNRVMEATGAYNSRVAGAVSPQPGLILGEPGEGRVLVAQSGRVRIKVDASYGAIQAGDLLVTSPRAGYAMRSQGVPFGDTELHRPGTVLGKALESLPEGAGEVLVLLTLQ